jgi:hypothetical protein
MRSSAVGATSSGREAMPKLAVICGGDGRIGKRRARSGYDPRRGGAPALDVSTSRMAKLVPAIAADDVDAAGMAHEDLRHAPERLVARGVAEIVVHRLEAVRGRGETTDTG